MSDDTDCGTLQVTTDIWSCPHKFVLSGTFPPYVGFDWPTQVCSFSSLNSNSPLWPQIWQRSCMHVLLFFSHWPYFFKVSTQSNILCISPVFTAQAQGGVAQLKCGHFLWACQFTEEIAMLEDQQLLVGQAMYQCMTGKCGMVHAELRLQETCHSITSVCILTMHCVVLTFSLHFNRFLHDQTSFNVEKVHLYL